MAGTEVSLSWRQVSYTLPPAKKGDEPKTVLREAFGECRPKQVVAILGPSGAGKTSLLNALAGRIPLQPGAVLSGNVLLQAKGEAYDASIVDIAAVSAYVEQDDALFALSTVEETLTMIAKLRLTRLPVYEQAQRVDEVINTLGLAPARHTIIGSDKPGQRGISGGERKRVHLGMELLHRPKLIFADEPTSGLDSFQALNVMTALNELATAGHTVCCSVHQPRSSIYALFDQVVLMAGGSVAYCGPAGKECASHFSALGQPVPQNFNPADHYLDVISIDYRNPEAKTTTEATVASIITGCPFARQVTPSPMGTVLPSDLLVQQGRQVPFSVAFTLLVRRTWRELTRDRTALIVKNLLALFFALLFGFVYWQMDMSQTSLQNRTGVLFFMAMNQAFGSVINTAKAIPQQLKVVTRERANRLYDVLPFYLATFICQLPLELLPQVFFGSLLYAMTGLRPGAEHMFTYIGVLVLENFVGIAIGMCLSAVFGNVEQAAQIAPLIVVVFLTFSGFFLNLESIPAVFAPLKQLSFIRYSFQALAVNELKGNNGFECPKQRFGPPCFQGDDWLANLKFQDVTVHRSCTMLGVEILFFNVLAYQLLVKARPRFLRPAPTAEMWAAA